MTIMNMASEVDFSRMRNGARAFIFIFAFLASLSFGAIVFSGEPLALRLAAGLCIPCSLGALYFAGNTESRRAYFLPSLAIVSFSFLAGIFGAEFLREWIRWGFSGKLAGEFIIITAGLMAPVFSAARQRFLACLVFLAMTGIFSIAILFMAGDGLAAGLFALLLAASFIVCPPLGINLLSACLMIFFGAVFAGAFGAYTTSR